MLKRKNGNGSNALWNLTNTVMITACLVITGLFSYLALCLRSNATEIGANRTKSEVNATVIDILGKSIPKIEEHLDKIDGRLYRLEAHFNTLPKVAAK